VEDEGPSDRRWAGSALRRQRIEVRRTASVRGSSRGRVAPIGQQGQVLQARGQGVEVAPTRPVVLEEK